MQEGGVDTHDVRKVCTQHQGLNAKNVVPANNRIGKHIYNVRRKKSGLFIFLVVPQESNLDARAFRSLQISNAGVHRIW